MDSSNPRDRTYYMFNQKNWYFEDSKTHNAFVRIRRDHLKQLGVINAVEIDFYEVRMPRLFIFTSYIVLGFQEAA